MFTDLVAARRAPSRPGSARAYIRDWKFATAVVLGAITGWIGYEILYDSNPVWGAGGADGVKLFWTCFSFQLAGIGAIDLVRRMVGDGRAAHVKREELAVVDLDLAGHDLAEPAKRRTVRLE